MQEPRDIRWTNKAEALTDPFLAALNVPVKVPVRKRVPLRKALEIALVAATQKHRKKTPITNEAWSPGMEAKDGLQSAKPLSVRGVVQVDTACSAQCTPDKPSSKVGDDEEEGKEGTDEKTTHTVLPPRQHARPRFRVVRVNDVNARARALQEKNREVSGQSQEGRGIWCWIRMLTSCAATSRRGVRLTFAAEQKQSS
jgi:hypothetical protein